MPSVISSTSRLSTIFVCPPGSSRPQRLALDLNSSTLRQIKLAAHRFICPIGVEQLEEKEDDIVDNLYLTVNGKPLECMDDDLSLATLGVVYGSIIRCNVRIRGGAMLNMKVKTQFGCVCCGNRFTYDCCKGRIYDVTASSIQDVQVIYDNIAKENEDWLKKEPNAKLFTKKGLLLEPEKKVLFYDMQDKDELTMYIQPFLWFNSNFRSGGKTSDEDEEEAELQRRIAAKRAAKDKGITADPNAEDEAADVDVEAMAT